MKNLIPLLLALLTAGLPLSAQEAAKDKKPFEIYAEFLQDTKVDLSDGAVWMMDKGDCFPVYMFKEQQTKVVLKIASATFQVDASNLKVLPEAQSQRALESYRKNLAQYLTNQPAAWLRDAKKQKADAKESKGEKKAAPVAEKSKDRSPQ